tara:strand:+ start:1152 stop:2876 length:1725 start_codon:yes stop_codon:yes gene_type:complete
MAIKYYFSKVGEMFHKSRKVYGRNNEFKFLKVIFFNIIVIVLDLLSVALILPVIDLIVNSGKSTFFNIPVFSNKLNLNYLLFTIVTIFGIKSILTLMINKYQFNIIFNLSKNLSETIYKKYIRKSYVFFTENNSSILLRNVYNECNIFSNGVILTTIRIISEILILFFFLIFLLKFNYAITLSLIFFFGLLGFIYITLVKNILYNLGTNRTKSESGRIKFIQEGFRSFQLIKIFNLKDYFTKKYKKYNDESHQIFVKERFLSILPKIIFEFSTILFLVLLVYFCFNYYENKDELIIMLSAFSLVSIRLLPIINSIFYSLQTLRFNSPVINNLYKIYFETENEKERKIENSITFTKSLELKNLYYKYKDTTVNILDNLNLKIKKGDIVSISGVSGSGKTSLLNIIMGILNIEQGELFVDDNKIDNKRDFNLTNLSFVPQSTFIFDENIVNNVILNKKFDETKFQKTLEYSGLNDFYYNLKDKEKSLGESGIKISGGQMQRISIARAIYRNPDLIVLDEPTSSIDKKTSNQLFDNLKKLNNETNCTLILVSHNPLPVNFATINLSLESGKLKILST